MPLLYPHNKLDYNNDSIISASKIVSARSRERMTDPLRDPDASVIKSLQKSKELTNAMNTFNLSFGQLRDLIRTFKSRAVEAIRDGEFESAIGYRPEGIADDIPPREQEQMFFEEEHPIRDITEDDDELTAFEEIHPNIPEGHHDRFDYRHLDLGRRNARNVDEPPPATEEDIDLYEDPLGVPLFADLEGFGRKAGSHSIRDRVFDYLVKRAKKYSSALMKGGAKTKQQKEEEWNTSNTLADLLAEELQIYRQQRGRHSERTQEIKKIEENLKGLLVSTRDKRKLPIIQRTLEKVQRGLPLTEREAKYAYLDPFDNLFGLSVALKDKGLIGRTGTKKFEKLREAQEDWSLSRLQDAEDIMAEREAREQEEEEKEEEEDVEPVDRYGERLPPHEYHQRAHDYDADALPVEHEPHIKASSLIDRLYNPHRYEPVDNVSVFSDLTTSENSKRPNINYKHLQEPIENVLTAILTRIIQAIQRLDTFVVSNLKSQIRNLTPEQIVTINKAINFLKDAKRTITHPEEDIDIFNGLSRVSFTSEMIKVFYTEIDKLMFDLLVVSKSSGQEYPDINEAHLFQGVVGADGLVEEGGSRGRRHQKRYSNVLVNFYGEPIGEGKPLHSIWSGRMRDCKTKYLL